MEGAGREDPAGWEEQHHPPSVPVQCAAPLHPPHVICDEPVRQPSSLLQNMDL